MLLGSSLFRALLLLGLATFYETRAGLSDFGGDVSQYMALLQGSSAFSFKPSSVAARSPIQQPFAGSDEDAFPMRDSPILRDGQGHRKRDKAASRSQSALGDFGGDYGNYLKLLEGDSALGFNPQSDPISDNQDLQSDVFGGGMSGKFWSMYKGSTSYDSFDEGESDAMNVDDSDGPSTRQSGEEDQLEDMPNPLRGERKSQQKTVMVAVKPSKQKVTEIFKMFKEAISAKDKNKLKSILDSLDMEKLVDTSNEESTRSLDVDVEDEVNVDKKQATDNDNEDDYSKESQKENESRSVKKNFEDFIDKMKTNMPDPITTSKGLTMSYRNLTMYGLTDMNVCGTIKKSFGMSKGAWKSDVCLPKLTVTVDCISGPGVPFRTRVAAIFKQPKLEMTFVENPSGEIHVISVKTLDTSGSKFVPTYDSSIPLNPWSKVSLSGYLVARVKKMMPSLLDKTILKISHIVETLD